MRIVVMRLPKKEGPPKSARHPRCFCVGFSPLADFPFDFFGAVAAMRRVYNKCLIFLFFRYTRYMTLVEYKKALLKYAPLENFAAGLELLGPEVKALRNRLGSLDGARVVVRGGEAFIIGMTIPSYQAANTPKHYEPERARRLLLTKKEIAILADAESKKGLTIIPLEVYTNNRFVKARIAIVRGKGKRDRREDLKKRDALREASRVLKNR